MKRCPNCGKKYEPELKKVEGIAMQVAYPKEPAWKREQLISGLCSQGCWKEFLGLNWDD